MIKEKPGKFPFTRGIHKNMYRDRLWTMRQYSGFTSAEESNNRYKYLLENGVTGLSIAFDLPTQIGYDSDHPISEGEVGKVGVPISTLQNMEVLLDGIPLDIVSTSMTINSTAAILLAFYIAIAEKQGISLKKIKGTIQNDILKEYIARGTYIYPPIPSLRITTDIFEFCDNYLPQWNSISISGYHIREAGSSAVQELAFTFSNAISYVKAAKERGLDPNRFGRRFSFFFNSHNGFLTEIAKFRAARKIWATIMKDRFDVKDEKALKCRFHTQTGGSTLTANQIDNNVVRTTIQALSAVMGGTQSLHTNSRDEALSLPTDDAAKLALRTQQIIAHESEIANYPDPFGGSYVIEELTNNLVKDSIKIIENIDQMGGSVSAIEKGWIQNEIASNAYEYQKDLDSKKRIIVGLNQFDDKKYIQPDILKIDENKVQNQLTSLNRLKESRNNDQVNTQLSQLKIVAKSQDNIIPRLISCAKNNCTLGEIADTLRNVFGEYQDH